MLLQEDAELIREWIQLRVASPELFMSDGEIKISP